MEQIFFTEKSEIGAQKTPMEITSIMATGGVIYPSTPIEKMTLLELHAFLERIDAKKYQDSNAFKGVSRKNLRVQAQEIYENYLEQKNQKEVKENKTKDFDEMDEIDEFAGGGTAGDRKSPLQSATSVQEGTIAIGFDASFYATVLNKNSIGSWRKIDKTNFDDDLRILSWSQNISGRDKSYEGVSTITFNWENDFDIDIRLTIKQISRVQLQLLMFFQNADRIIAISELPSIGQQFATKQMQDTFIAKIREDKSSLLALSDLETMTVVAGENLKHDFNLIYRTLLAMTETTIPSLFNFRTADLNSKFNRTDLLPQPASFDPFEVSTPVNDIIDSTDPRAWEIKYKVGDVVKIRRDQCQDGGGNFRYDYDSPENRFVITAVKYLADVKRPENPSGTLYSVGSYNYEGKDIELKQDEQKPVQREPKPQESDKNPSPEILEISEKSEKEVQKEVKAIIENVETPKKSRKELKQDYADLSFLISITQPIDVITMSELKQQARTLKDEIDRLGLVEKDVLLAENHIFDELFTASSIQPKHRYNLTPAIDGFAPDGTPTQLPKKIYEMVSTDQFEDWFGNFQLAYQFQNTSYSDVPCSVVKNEHFEPQIVYHGTGSEFSFFDFNKFPAMYFAENFSYAEWFANEKGRMEGGHDGYVYPFLLNIKNPLDLTHFGIRKISPQEFADWMYLQCGLMPDELKMNKALLDPNQTNWAWVYLRSGSEMLKVLRDTKLFDGIVYFEQNPPIPPTAPNYMTKGFIIFDANNAKIVDPERHNVLLASMRSFYLKKGGKL
jgi:hypothetical protein